jgi:hypothetical protein
MKTFSEPPDKEKVEMLRCAIKEIDIWTTVNKKPVKDELYLAVKDTRRVIEKLKQKGIEL